jgi:hypothetical protein
MKTLLRSLLLISAFQLFSISAFSQGSLTPPGPPAPTMKTLSEVEPRFNLQNAPASNVDTTNANYHYIINQPGSYYLSANLPVTKTNGIQINSEGVTLDLNGFQVRNTGTGGNGIEIPATSHRASVRNGSIKGFAYGINSLVSVGPSYVNACSFRDLSVSSCTTDGIYAANGAVLESCRAYNNSGDSGISVSNGSLINCTASSNSGTYGINAAGSSVTNCTANNNSGYSGIKGSGSSLTNCSANTNSGTTGISADGSSLTNCSAGGNAGGYGILANDSSLTNCSASYNFLSGNVSAGIYAGRCILSHCSADANSSSVVTSTATTGMGISAAYSTIQDCTARANTGDGIQASANCQITGNTSDGNGTGGTGAGVHATGGTNRIERNNVTDNTVGVQVDGTVNLVIGNSARGNTGGNYSIVAGNKVGLVVTPAASGAVSGNTGGTDFSTSSWSNIAY